MCWGQGSVTQLEGALWISGLWIQTSNWGILFARGAKREQLEVCSSCGEKPQNLSSTHSSSSSSFNIRTESDAAVNMNPPQILTLSILDCYWQVALSREAQWCNFFSSNSSNPKNFLPLQELSVNRRRVQTQLPLLFLSLATHLLRPPPRGFNYDLKNTI